MTLIDFKFFQKENTILFDELCNLLHVSVVHNILGESKNFMILQMNYIGNDTYECFTIHKKTYVERSVIFKLNLGGTDELTIN